MSEQEQKTPVWHAIVGEGWEPVQFGDEARRLDYVLESQGWVHCDGGGFVYSEGMQPRRRRKRSYDIFTHMNGITYGRVTAAKPGDRFMLTQNGQLVPIEVEE